MSGAREPALSGRKKRAVCAGEGGLVDPDELEIVDGTLLHKVGDAYHRVANGVPVLVENGKVADLIEKPIQPAEYVRY
jgi:hypothetical protein